MGLAGIQTHTINVHNFLSASPLPPPPTTTTTQALERIAEDIKGQSIDVVLYVDRLDLYRVEPLDKRVSWLEGGGGRHRASGMCWGLYCLHLRVCVWGGVTC
jgi:hypothetical protein